MIQKAYSFYIIELIIQHLMSTNNIFILSGFTDVRSLSNKSTKANECSAVLIELNSFQTKAHKAIILC